ncbi:hypothetical protein [Brucella pseudogrignonensis]|uniref:Uncharacterized protein n=1 Tax=Brucella pseudogrignonensis TaxID=419475 RepID=A0A256GEW3_9HYPH|nr:hypothetical protein [Brucella pseudogrignonensis]NKX16235.1 hypothetical protein [Brucella pseudogrignonensis]OYR25677.1 hypothetical protein CEV34_2650 [Brucella pseudogrignonensis]
MTNHADHLSAEQVELYLTAISTDKPIDDRIQAAGDLLARPLPYDARREIRSIYLNLTDRKYLAEEGIAA